MNDQAKRAAPLDIRLMNLATRVLFGVLIGCFLIYGIYWVIDQPRYEIQTVEIKNVGQLKYADAEKIKQLSLEHIKGNFFISDLREMEQAFKQLIWVKSVSLERKWPYTIEVNIREFKPVAYAVDFQGKTQFLDEDGFLFDANVVDVPVMDLPLMRGSLGSTETMWKLYQKVYQALADAGLHLQVVELSAHGLWSLQFKEGTVVTVGRGDEEALMNEIMHFASTIKMVMVPYGGRKLLTADLRYSAGYAIRVDGVKTSAITARSKGRH